MKLVSWEDFLNPILRDEPRCIITAKYEFSKMIASCKEPTLRLLAFLEAENDNFLTKVVSERYPIGRTRTKTKTELVWVKGTLFQEIGFEEISDIHELGFSSHKTWFGFQWANQQEKNLLEAAIQHVIDDCSGRSLLAAQRKIDEANDTVRKSISLWLGDYEESR